MKLPNLIDLLLVFTGFLVLIVTGIINNSYYEANGRAVQARLAYEYCQDLLNTRRGGRAR